MSSSENFPGGHGSSGKRSASDEFAMDETDFSRQLKRLRTNPDLSAAANLENAGQASSARGYPEHRRDRIQNILHVSNINEEDRGGVLT